MRRRASFRQLRWPADPTAARGRLHDGGGTPCGPAKSSSVGGMFIATPSPLSGSTRLAASHDPTVCRIPSSTNPSPHAPPRPVARPGKTGGVPLAPWPVVGGWHRAIAGSPRWPAPHSCQPARRIPARPAAVDTACAANRCNGVARCSSANRRIARRRAIALAGDRLVEKPPDTNLRTHPGGRWHRSQATELRARTGRRGRQRPADRPPSRVTRSRTSSMRRPSLSAILDALPPIFSTRFRKKIGTWPAVWRTTAAPASSTPRTFMS